MEKAMELLSQRGKTNPSDLENPLPSVQFNADAFRDGPVRLCGYANEVGESFRPLVSRWVVGASYGVAGTYVVADAAWRASHPPNERSALVEAGDAVRADARTAPIHLELSLTCRP